MTKKELLRFKKLPFRPLGRAFTKYGNLNQECWILYDVFHARVCPVAIKVMKKERLAVLFREVPVKNWRYKENIKDFKEEFSKSNYRRIGCWFTNNTEYSVWGWNPKIWAYKHLH